MGQGGNPPPPPPIFSDLLTLSHLGDRLCPSKFTLPLAPRTHPDFQIFLRTSFLYVHIKTSRRFARSYRFLMGSPLWFLYRPHCYAKFVAKTAAVEAPSGHCFLCMCSTCNLLFSLESAGPTDICLLSIWQHCTKLRLDRIQSSDNL